MSLTDFSNLQTEALNHDAANIDVISTEDFCRIMNEADTSVPIAVSKCIPKIARVIDLITARMRKGGRVVYIGAGTSGRLGVLDASEIPPTFSAPPGQFIGIIAGGDNALRQSIEGAEDSLTLPITTLQSVSPPLTPLDTLVGIASSGRTPYVLAGMKYAKDKLGMLSIGIACVDGSEMRTSGCCGLNPSPELAGGALTEAPVVLSTEECAIECPVGPEIVSGSTRLKSGTATKLILNMISTGVMVRLGKTYGNMMIDVKSSNTKLIHRARRIFTTVTSQASPHMSSRVYAPEEIDALLKRCNGSVKIAIVVAKLEVSPEKAKEILDNAGGVLKKVLEGVLPVTHDPKLNVARTFTKDTLQVDGNRNVDWTPNLVLCVDAGGSKCRAVIANADGLAVAHGEAGPCNFVTLGHAQALQTLFAAVLAALSNIRSHGYLPPHIGIFPGSSPQSILQGKTANTLGFQAFKAAWIGGAGLDRSIDLESVKQEIKGMLGFPQGLTEMRSGSGHLENEVLFITNDAALLAPSIVHGTSTTTATTTATTTTSPQTGVVLIAGTGSLCYTFSLAPPPTPPSHKPTPQTPPTFLPTPHNRTSGWGYLLGDEFSAYGIGREGVRLLLQTKDSTSASGPEHQSRRLTPMLREILAYFGCREPGEAISAVYDPKWGSKGVWGSTRDLRMEESAEPKLRVAGVAPIVVKYAFGASRLTSSGHSTDVDAAAVKIVEAAVAHGIGTIVDVLGIHEDGSRRESVGEMTLVLGGGLIQENGLRSLFCGELEREGLRFGRVVWGEDAAECGARWLAKWM